MYQIRIEILNNTYICTVLFLQIVLIYKDGGTTCIQYFCMKF